ncbi:hypothetical protein [Maricaulis salignorans]|uniref:Uncharacterized protein n=1 Tax=Maricaulis salignorans TaxID=144026 RepID=A0A1G9RN83_9PROT|nr:hypothetical protein [Maricaulis salignorans]SDM24663.1 hypothetical protein SAMN04488568_10787 [Maricaulis salignorans]
MAQGRGVLFHLSSVGFDPFGRVFIADRDASIALGEMLSQADAISCRSGCGAPLSCDTALITREELVRVGPELLVNNADFASIIRKRKAVGAEEVVIVFNIYREMASSERASP